MAKKLTAKAIENSKPGPQRREISDGGSGLYPTIGDRPVSSVKRSEIVRLLDRIEDRSGPRMADVALAALRRVFHWHEKRTDDFRSPIIRGMSRQNAAEHRRTRVLDDDELRR